MKYIRTKDGRIIDLTRYDNKTSPVGKAFGLVTLIDKKRICDLEIFEKDIIKYADTIEELIDTFVVKYAGDYLPCNIGLRLPKKSWKRFWEENKPKFIYGAICTDKGLIYVAKMNKDGVLCLI